MQMLCHRGWSSSKEEENTLRAFSRAFEAGYGVEADIRDDGKQLIIAHDMQPTVTLTLAAFFALYAQQPNKVHLALNIKSSELHQPIAALLTQYDIQNYGLFDMAVPDMVKYINHGGLQLYCRQSEHEPIPLFYDQSMGVWLDEFEQSWITDDILLQHHQHGKKITLISPELQGKPHQKRWQEWKHIDQQLGGTLMLCTDHPQEAAAFFND